MDDDLLTESAEHIEVRGLYPSNGRARAARLPAARALACVRLIEGEFSEFFRFPDEPLALVWRSAS